MTTAETTRPGFSEPLRTEWANVGGSTYALNNVLRVRNNPNLWYTDRQGRKWPIPYDFGFDGPSTPDLLRSIGPNWRLVGAQSALHDRLTRTAGYGNEQLHAVALERFGSGAAPYQWRVADDLWWESLDDSLLNDGERSAYWLAVRLGSIRRTRERYGVKVWWREIRWTFREAIARNRAVLIGQFLWGLVSLRWLREQLGGKG